MPRKTARNRLEAPEGRLIGYARVSTDDQDTQAQRVRLRKAGCALVYEDTASGAIQERPELARCLGNLAEGDTLVVVRLDRLGRSAAHVLNVVADLQKRGIDLRSLTESFDTSSAQGVLMLTMLAGFAQFEKTIIRERTMEGLVNAKANGKLAGNPDLRARDPMAIAMLKASRADTFLQRSRDASRRWKRIVLELRPHLSWEEVTNRVNADDRSVPALKPYQLTAHCRRLARAGDIPWTVMDRTRVPTDVLALMTAERLRADSPTISRSAIARALNEAGIRPPGGGQWYSETVKNLLGEGHRNRGAQS